MDLTLSALYESLQETLYLELKKAKKLNKAQIQRFKDYFCMESEDLGIFYNGINIIITDRQTYGELENFIKISKITTRFENTEHNLYFVVYPYFNDTLITQALNG